jgi:quercetin dioxygenase-like cupin family protein
MEIIENPLSGETFTFLEDDDGRSRLRMEVVATVGGASPPRHIHRQSEERFEILDGEVTVLIGKESRLLRAGDTCQVPPGHAHTWRNSGDRPARMVVEFTPPGEARSFFQTFCGLAQEGRCDHRGQPPLLQVAASTPLWQMYLASPPIPVQQVVMAALRPLAFARGYRARYPRFEAGATAGEPG